MNLGFKPCFVPRVRDGSKTHTIRGGKRWRVGMRGDLWENMRGPKTSVRPQTLIFRAPIVRVEDIQILVSAAPTALDRRMRSLPLLTFWIDGVQLSPSEADTFAQADGFADVVDMYRFWVKTHGPGLFDGQVIHWDYKRRRMEKFSARAA